MLLLTSTSDVLRVVTSAAGEVDVHASWVDNAAGTITPGRTNTDITTATTTPVVGSPAAATQRTVNFLSVANEHATNANNITVAHYDGTYEARLLKVTLAAGESLQFRQDSGFQVLTSAGAIKTSLNQGQNTITSGMSAVVLGADVINNNATLNTIASVTGLSFPVTAGSKYWFKFTIIYTAQATSTGSRWSISGPTTTLLAYTSEYALTATTETVNYATAYDTPSASNATSVATAGNIATIEGIIVPSANGAVIARFASEIANSAITAKAGSVVYYQQVA